jgi:hypothetical protein
MTWSPHALAVTVTLVSSDDAVDGGARNGAVEPLPTGQAVAVVGAAALVGTLVSGVAVVTPAARGDVEVVVEVEVLGAVRCALLEHATSSVPATRLAQTA